LRRLLAVDREVVVLDDHLVAGVYAAFTEGFETHDLVSARELLAQLGA